MILKLNKKEALKEINTWKDSDNIIDYFKNVVVGHLLPELTINELLERVTPIQIRNQMHKVEEEKVISSGSI